MTVTKTQRRARVALGSIFATIGGTGLGVNVFSTIDLLNSDRSEILLGIIPIWSIIFAAMLYSGIRQIVNRNEPNGIQIPDMASGDFQESVRGQALAAVGFLPLPVATETSPSLTLAAVNPTNLTPAEQEILKEFLRATQPIVDDMDLPHLSPELRERQVESIRFHATEAAKRLREYQDTLRGRHDGQAWGSIAGSGYVPPMD